MSNQHVHTYTVTGDVVECSCGFRHDLSDPAHQLAAYANVPDLPPEPVRYAGTIDAIK